MEVTRREMLTAASAAGALGIIGQQSARAAAPQQAPKTLTWATPANDNQWDRCVKLLQQTEPDIYAALDRNKLQTWITPTPTLIYAVRGGVRSIATAPVTRQLAMVFAISYDNTVHDNYKLHALGGVFRGTKKRAKIERALDELREGLMPFKFATENKIIFPSVFASGFRPRSFLGLMMQYIVGKHHSKYEITKQQATGLTPARWLLKVDLT